MLMQKIALAEARSFVRELHKSNNWRPGFGIFTEALPVVGDIVKTRTDKIGKVVRVHHEWFQGSSRRMLYVQFFNGVTAKFESAGMLVIQRYCE